MINRVVSILSCLLCFCRFVLGLKVTFIGRVLTEEVIIICKERRVDLHRSVSSSRHYQNMISSRFTPTLLLLGHLPLHLLVGLRLLRLCNTKQTLSSSAAASGLSGVGGVFTLDRSRRDGRRQEDHHRHYQQLSVGTINTDQYRSLPDLPRTNKQFKSSIHGTKINTTN